MNADDARTALLGSAYALTPGTSVASLIVGTTGDLCWVRLVISRGICGQAGPADITAAAAGLISWRYDASPASRANRGMLCPETGTEPGALAVIELGRHLWPDLPVTGRLTHVRRGPRDSPAPASCQRLRRDRGAR